MFKGPGVMDSIRNKALRMYKVGGSVRSIVAQLSLSRSTFYFWRRVAKIKLHPRGGWRLSETTRQKMIRSRRRGQRHWNWKGNALNRICAQCSKTFRKSNRKEPARGKIFCSRKCSNTYQVEERHACWKGGSPRCRGGRYTIWARAVLMRHGMKCKKCGSEKSIEAHHIRPWAKFADLRYKVSNGIPLCGLCHINVHREKKRPWLILSA